MLRRGKKVAEVYEDGSVGNFKIIWRDKNNITVVKALDSDDKVFSFYGTVEEAIFHDEIMNLPKVKSEGQLVETSKSERILIFDMVDSFLNKKKMMAELKNRFMIKVDNGDIISWNFSQRNTFVKLKEHVEQKYPTAKILNNMCIDEALKVYEI